MHYSPKISVVIPIYNVAPYLKECLNFVINQTYQNLQIILVNDGIADESENIAIGYLDDPRVEPISTDNGGLSRARNIGLARAKGEYVYFDYIDLGFIEGSKSLIDHSGVQFLEGKIYEDEGFLYMIFPFCKQFALYCGKPYYYRQRQGNIINSNKNFRSYDLLDIFEAIYVFYKENGLLSRFDPPYFFLYDCAIGYNNEKEYLKKARELEKKLQIPKTLLYQVNM